MKIRLSDSIEVFGRCESWEAEKTGKTGVGTTKGLIKEEHRKNVTNNFKI